MCLRSTLLLYQGPKLSIILWRHRRIQLIPCVIGSTSFAVEQISYASSSRRGYSVAWEGEKLVCRRTSTNSHIEYKNRELFTRKAIASCILSRQRNGFELLWEIPSVEGVFSPRTNILDDVSVSLAPAQQTSNISTYEYYLYLKNKY